MSGSTETNFTCRPEQTECSSVTEQCGQPQLHATSSNEPCGVASNGGSFQEASVLQASESNRLEQGATLQLEEVASATGELVTCQNLESGCSPKADAAFPGVTASYGQVPHMMPCNELWYMNPIPLWYQARRAMAVGVYFALQHLKAGHGQEPSPFLMLEGIDLAALTGEDGRNFEEALWEQLPVADAEGVLCKQFFAEQCSVVLELESAECGLEMMQYFVEELEYGDCCFQRASYLTEFPSAERVHSLALSWVHLLYPHLAYYVPCLVDNVDPAAEEQYAADGCGDGDGVYDDDGYNYYGYADDDGYNDCGYADDAGNNDDGYNDCGYADDAHNNDACNDDDVDKHADVHSARYVDDCKENDVSEVKISYLQAATGVPPAASSEARSCSTVPRCSEELQFNENGVPVVPFNRTTSFPSPLSKCVKSSNPDSTGVFFPLPQASTLQSSAFHNARRFQNGCDCNDPAESFEEPQECVEPFSHQAKEAGSGPEQSRSRSARSTGVHRPKTPSTGRSATRSRVDSSSSECDTSSLTCTEYSCHSSEYSSYACPSDIASDSCSLIEQLSDDGQGTHSCKPPTACTAAEVHQTENKKLSYHAVHSAAEQLQLHVLDERVKTLTAHIQKLNQQLEALNNRASTQTEPADEICHGFKHGCLISDDAHDANCTENPVGASPVTAVRDLLASVPADSSVQTPDEGCPVTPDEGCPVTPDEGCPVTPDEGCRTPLCRMCNTRTAEFRADPCGHWGPCGTCHEQFCCDLYFQACSHCGKQVQALSYVQQCNIGSN